MYTDSETPIEFNIFIGESTVTDAQLSIYAWDIDETSGEIHQVHLNGNYIGDLTGAKYQWHRYSISIPHTLSRTRGKKYRPGSMSMCIIYRKLPATTVDRGQLRDRQASAS
ncbi:MAG: hypothetical protein U5N26_09080 [Candidatus Marinimicrobia bacterium]|nr:hypothetical protein [Candidatus Neomarinimicrobiota bacterium]